MEARGVASSLDRTGFFCPEPVIRVNQEIGNVAMGEVLELLTDDPSSTSDIESWAKRRGQELLSTEEQGSRFRFLIRRTN